MLFLFMTMEFLCTYLYVFLVALAQYTAFVLGLHAPTSSIFRVSVFHSCCCC